MSRCDQEVWTVDQLIERQSKQAVVWALPKILTYVEKALGCRAVPFPRRLGTNMDMLIAVGGGVLLDLAKAFRLQHCPQATLVAVPSIWGSGAEASPIVVLNISGKKDIKINPDYTPEVRVVWPELAKDLPQSLIRPACGDVWAHALESFISPLATTSIQKEISQVIDNLLTLEPVFNPLWFDLSAKACALQSQVSVGLAHGIAHTIEGQLTPLESGQHIGHAMLCATLMWPVFRYNRQASKAVDQLFQTYSLSADAIELSLKALFDAELFEIIVPVIERHWRAILRDPSSRTNAVLVRPSALDFFRTFLSGVNP